MNLRAPHIRTFLLLLFLMVQPSTYGAKKPEAEADKKKKKEKTEQQIYYGFSSHLDVASPLMNPLIDKSIFAFEASVDVDLLHKYFPIVEIGYGRANKLSETGVHYKASAPFYRVGVNFNLMRTKDKDNKMKPLESYPFIGLRYGFSAFNSYLEGVHVQDNYWHASQSVSFNNKAVYVGWIELVAGVRVDIKKGFIMGWSGRLSALSHNSKSVLRNELWYVPGFGKNNTFNFSFNYTLGYTFKYTKKIKTKNKDTKL